MSPTEPDRPTEPDEYRPRPLLGVGFWLTVAFGVISILAGAGVALLGPRYLSSGSDVTPPARDGPASPDPRESP